MPMKWTAENDQLLFLKILETSSINPDADAVAKTWRRLSSSRFLSYIFPAKLFYSTVENGSEGPIPWAIRKRLIKLRSMANEKGAGTFKIATIGKRFSPTKSPSKVTKRRGLKTKKQTMSAGRRKHGKKDDEFPEDSDTSATTFKSEDNKIDDYDEESSTLSPQQKIKTEPSSMDEVYQRESSPYGMPQKV
ncbi:MAG: hypothetical protein Q9219_007553 [cf. Caloplaca sp. 3 TL-2023]